MTLLLFFVFALELKVNRQPSCWDPTRVLQVSEPSLGLSWFQRLNRVELRLVQFLWFCLAPVQLLACRQSCLSAGTEKLFPELRVGEKNRFIRSSGASSNTEHPTHRLQVSVQKPASPPDRRRVPDAVSPTGWLPWRRRA